MKISKKQLKKIIKEEFDKELSEGVASKWFRDKTTRAIYEPPGSLGYRGDPTPRRAKPDATGVASTTTPATPTTRAGRWLKSAMAPAPSQADQARQDQLRAWRDKEAAAEAEEAERKGRDRERSLKDLKAKKLRKAKKARDQHQLSDEQKEVLIAAGEPVEPQPRQGIEEAILERVLETLK